MGYRLGISYSYPALPYKPAFSDVVACPPLDQRIPKFDLRESTRLPVKQKLVTDTYSLQDNITSSRSRTSLSP